MERADTYILRHQAGLVLHLSPPPLRHLTQSRLPRLLLLKLLDLRHQASPHIQEDTSQTHIKKCTRVPTPRPNSLFMSYAAGEGDGGRGKGLQLRLELGSVVTGEGEREGRVVVGDNTDKVCEGKTDVCETSVTHKPLSTTIHTKEEATPQTQQGSGSEGGGEE
jgi:hypothetical protein